MAETDNAHDDIFADVRAAMTETEQPDPAPVERPVEEAPAETAQQAADRARDEQGRFAKNEEGKRETLKVKDPVVQAVASQEIAENGLLKTPEEKAAAAIAPPLEWKGMAKTNWEKLPEPVKKEINEHWSEIGKVRATYEPIAQAIEPHRAILERDAGSVGGGINELMKFYNEYLTNPVGLIQRIARQTGINLGQAQQQPGEPGTASPPDIASLIEQAVQQRIAPIQQQFEQTENNQIQQTLQGFASDPKHPFFQDVRTQMGVLLQSGSAKTLDEAYEQAIWANPSIRPQLLAAQGEDAATARAAQLAAAQKAKAASLRGSPIPGASGGGSPGNSVHDDVRAAMAEVAGA